MCCDNYRILDEDKIFEVWDYRFGVVRAKLVEWKRAFGKIFEVLKILRLCYEFLNFLNVDFGYSMCLKRHLMLNSSLTGSRSTTMVYNILAILFLPQ